MELLPKFRPCVFEHHFSLFESHTMKCLHRKTAACSTKKDGTFWFCGQRPSCEFFRSDEDCYMYTKGFAAFRESGCLHSVCPTYQKLPKLWMVKNKIKQNYRWLFFVCAEQENQCKFWQWGDIYEYPRPLCQHGMVCCERKVKKDGPVLITVNNRQLPTTSRQITTTSNNPGQNIEVIYHILSLPTVI